LTPSINNDNSNSIIPRAITSSATNICYGLQCIDTVKIFRRTSNSSLHGCSQDFRLWLTSTEVIDSLTCTVAWPSGSRASRKSICPQHARSPGCWTHFSWSDGSHCLCGVSYLCHCQSVKNFLQGYLLGLTIAVDLGLERHALTVCKMFLLASLRRVHCSRDNGSLCLSLKPKFTTLVWNQISVWNQN